MRPVLQKEVEFTAVRSQGPGGQHVNKVSSAVHLRFDIRASSLPDAVKQRLLVMGDQRVTNEGVIVIKAQSSRRLEQNKAEALKRLEEMVAQAAYVPPVRRSTQPSKAARRQRLDDKAQRARVKADRSRIVC